jgi:arsenate reductase-like glutaredoxin family protein
MNIQIFGTRKNADVRAALRFFAERRVKVHFVDLNERAASPGELRRFADKFGTAAALSDERWLEKLALEPLLLRTPLVRNGSALTVGPAAATWAAWLAAGD